VAALSLGAAFGNLDQVGKQQLKDLIKSDDHKH
jgi:hypothetical protein